MMDRKTMLNDVARQITSRIPDHPLRVAIDGIDTAGKTTLANELAELLRSQGNAVIRASIDGFHHPKAVRSQRGSLSPEGYYEDSFNYPALKTALLDPLGQAGSRRYKVRVFDFQTNSAIETPEQMAETRAILIFDGVFLQRPEIRACWDIKIFVDIPFDLALTRAIERDVALFGSIEVVRERYLKRYIPDSSFILSGAHRKQTLIS